MSDHPAVSLTDWITAVSTAITAIAAAIAGAIAWRALIKDTRRSLPIVEADMKWVMVGSASCVELKVTIRNPLFETITWDSLQIERPRRSVFAKARFANLTGYSGQETLVELTRGTLNNATINAELDPAGTIRSGPTGRDHKTDMLERTIYLWPPETWDGGIVKVAFRLSGKALTIRDKRIARKSRISARPAKQTDANANKAAASIIPH